MLLASGRADEGDGDTSVFCESARPAESRAEQRDLRGFRSRLARTWEKPLDLLRLVDPDRAWEMARAMIRELLKTEGADGAPGGEEDGVAAAREGADAIGLPAVQGSEDAAPDLPQVRLLQGAGSSLSRGRVAPGSPVRDR